MRKMNHSGVVIEIPDDAKQQAILTLPDGMQVRVGPKKLKGKNTAETASMFLVYLESAATDLRAARDRLAASESGVKVTGRLVREAAERIDAAKLDDFDDPDEFVQLVARRSSEFARAREEHSAANSQAAQARFVSDDIVGRLERAEK